MMVPQPASFQIWDPMITVRNQSTEPRKLIFSPPEAAIRSFTRPSVMLSMFTTMPPSTTQDRKWGRYIRVCAVLLYTLERISLISSARIMGTGKEKMSLVMLKNRELRSTR